MKELIQNLLVYVVIVSVLRGLITNPKYSQYFQFFSGIIMILLMLSPVLSFFHTENTWYELLEENILKMDLSEIEGEMKIADKQFQSIVKQEYVETVEKQVTKMADEKGIKLNDVKVVLQEEGEEWAIAEITGRTGVENQVEKSEIAVETIRIGKEEEKTEKRDDSKAAKTLRKQICNYFVLGEDKVHLWK